MHRIAVCIQVNVETAIQRLPNFGAPMETMNVRASFNKTLGRPSFREKSSAFIADPITGLNFLGNIDLKQANLTKVDFTGADLTESVLIGAVLVGTIFTGADVTKTIFSKNEGLTDADKLDLQKRGAIFLDPPSSDVPSLVSH